MPEYICGIALGAFVSKTTYSKKVFFVIAELIALIILIFSIYAEKKLLGGRYYLMWSAMWIVPNLCLLFTFSYENGWISKLLGNKFFVMLGNISMEMFLIHQVFINYVSKTGIGKTLTQKYLVLVYLLLATVFLGYIVNKKIECVGGKK